MTVQIQKQKLSKKLEQLISDLVPDLDKLKPKIDVIFEQGRSEGLADIDIGSMVRTELKKHYSDRTIQRVLPETAKHKEHTSMHKTEPDKMSGSERKPIPADNVKIEPVIEPAQEQEIRSVAAANQSTEIKSREDKLPQSQPELQTSEAQTERPGPKEVKGIHNIAPEDYEIEELDLYDKPLLIEIVKYFHNRLWTDTTKWDKKIHEQGTEIDNLKEENAVLKKQLESVEPFVELFSSLPPAEMESWLQFMKNALRREKELRK